MGAIGILLELLNIAQKAAPIVVGQINAIKAQTGKSDDEILVDLGVTADRAEAKALALLARILADQAPKD